MEKIQALGVLGLATFFWILIGILSLIAMALFVLWVIALVDCIRRRDDEFTGGKNTKTVWLAVLIASLLIDPYWVSAPIYYFAIMRKVPKEKQEP